MSNLVPHPASARRREHAACRPPKYNRMTEPGALFGLVAYATYDLTNLATLKAWPIKLVVVDLIWGTILTAVVALATYGVIRTWLS